jgi:N-acetylglucosamine kinase-like BadF-type ATPase
LYFSSLFAQLLELSVTTSKGIIKGVRKMITFKQKKSISAITAYVLACAILLSQSLSALSFNPDVDDADYDVCIDGGGTKTTLQVVNKRGELMPLKYDNIESNSRSAGPTNSNIVGLPLTLDALKNLLTGLRVGPDQQDLQDIQNKAIICGLAGLDSSSEDVPLIQELFSSFGFKKSHTVLGADDDIAQHLIEKHGAILIAGTGSVCFSKDEIGGERSIGGYGWAFGDEGSGTYFGKKALVTAWSHLDQHKDPFILTEKLCELFEVSSIKEVLTVFYRGKLNACDIAKAAPLVFEAAFVKQDEVCKGIVDTGAGELAKLIQAAVAGSQQASFPIYLIGGIFKDPNADLFIDMIRQKVAYDPGLTFLNLAHENIPVQVIQRRKKRKL